MFGSYAGSVDIVVSFDFSPKGGPAGLVGKLVSSSSGGYVLEWSDGNTWTHGPPGAAALDPVANTFSDNFRGALAPVAAAIVFAGLWCLLLYGVRLVSLFACSGRETRERLPDEGEAPVPKEPGEELMQPKPCCTINPAIAATILVGIAVFKTLITKVLFAQARRPRHKRAVAAP